MPYVLNQGAHIHYQVEGEGPVLVLQHGLTFSLEYWRYYGYLDRLSRIYRLDLIDARGHGLNDNSYEREAFALKLLGEDVVVVLDTPPPPTCPVQA